MVGSRPTAGVAGDIVWRSIGKVLRRHLGFHAPITLAHHHEKTTQGGLQFSWLTGLALKYAGAPLKVMLVCLARGGVYILRRIPLQIRDKPTEVFFSPPGKAYNKSVEPCIC